MDADLREQLQRTLAGSYTLERELGGGGMSRVFVATETSLGRRVVIKVLPPELTEGVSVERFKREIQLAAQLQHPHVVGVLSAGETGGIPYYTMPLVDGESLRARLLRLGALPFAETIGYLRDVAKALVYAHGQGVVHRDIKPDNVLITGGSAVVTDFGIAKAIAAARTGAVDATITRLGNSVGTPAYMAPEQAAADPATNHRADIYAFGVMAYEMLAGQPPFHGRTPQLMLAAQMAEPPQPILELRADTPPMLADLVMRCLAKDPAARPQNATELARVLETVTSGGGHSALPEFLLDGRPRLGRALALWAAAFLGVAIVARAAIIAIGLPDWVFPGSVIVMALGLPVILATYLVHRRAHEAVTAQLTAGHRTASTPPLTRFALRVRPHVSWRRTTLGGAVALGVFVVMVSGFMVLRGLGIGPAGSLLAKGSIQKNERILVADFRSTGGDSSLGPVVTEAFRTGLGQSRSVTVMPATGVQNVLRRMQRDPGTLVDAGLAREIATREGIKVFVDGAILSVGGKYSVSAQLSDAQSGEVLASFAEKADSDGDILGAIDRLARGLRERIGESLRTIHDARPLEQVTTPSLEALRKYVQASRALSFDGAFDKGVALLNEAIAIDTGFAMAYRKLAVEMNNRRTDPERAAELIDKAFAHRDRLSDPERYLTEASYYSYGSKQDVSKAIAAYESLTDLQPENVTALNNEAVMYQYTREADKARSAVERASVLPDAPAVIWVNYGAIALLRGDTVEGRHAIRSLETQYARNTFGILARIRFLYVLGQVDSAMALGQSVLKTPSGDQSGRTVAERMLIEVAVAQGRLSESRRRSDDMWRAQVERGVSTAALEQDLSNAWLDAWHRGDTAAARRTLDRTLAAHPVASYPHVTRPYATLAALQALIGRVDQARATIALFDRERSAMTRLSDEHFRHQMLGDVAIAERRYDDAVREYRSSDVTTPCVVCQMPRLAHAYDLAGKTDSAIAVFERFVNTKDALRLTNTLSEGVDADYLAGSYKRLGELYEAAGNRQQALEYYLKFSDLWKTADPELQPKVVEIRQRIARLRRVEGR